MALLIIKWLLAFSQEIKRNTPVLNAGGKKTPLFGQMSFNKLSHLAAAGSLKPRIGTSPMDPS
jgi:hypothetical protein